MRCLSMIRIDENGGQVPSEQLMRDMGKLIEDMTPLAVLLLPGAAIGTTFALSSSRLRRGDPLIP